jgi:hypothetical protein
VNPKSEILEDGTQAHWIGNPKAEKLILNFHGTSLLAVTSSTSQARLLTGVETGGGYVLPAVPAQFEFVFQIMDMLKSKGKNAACLFLSYGISPSLSPSTSPN